MQEGFKNPYGSVNVKLEEMKDDELNLKAPSPEELDEMFSGIKNIMPTTEQSTQSESEILKSKVKVMTDSIAELEVTDAVDNYRKLQHKLEDKADGDALAYYGELLQERVNLLTDLNDLADPKRKLILPLKVILDDINVEVRKLKAEKTLDNSFANSEQIKSQIEKL